MEYLEHKKNPQTRTSADLLMQVLNTLFHQSIKQDSTGVSANILEKTAENNIKKILENPRREDLSIFLIEKIEGCHPILREIFHISIRLSKAFQLSDDLSNQISRLVFSIPLEFLCSSENLCAELANDSTSWNGFQRNSVKFHLCSEQIKSRDVIVSVEIEKCSLNVRPKIIEQNLGLRPRLFSFEIEGLKDDSGDKQSPDKKLIQKQLSIIRSESFYEENEIGFNLLNSTLPDIPDSEEEELSQNIFDLELSTEEHDEDAAISLYIKKCVGVTQLNIFSGLQSTEDLLKDWTEQ